MEDNISKFYKAFSAKYKNFNSEQEFRDYLKGAKRENIDKLYGAFNSKYRNFGSADEMASYLGWSENSGVESQGQNSQASAKEQTPQAQPTQSTPARPAPQDNSKWSVPQASQWNARMDELQKSVMPGEPVSMPERKPDEPKGNPFPSRNELGREIADLEQVLEAVKGDADFADEYEGRKSERDRRAKELGSLRGDIRNSGFDPSQLDEDNRYISENERRYGSALEDRKAARQVQADIDELKGQLQLIENTENRRRVEAKKKATSEKLDDEWRKAVMSGPRGSIPYNPGTKEEREDGVNIAAANSLYSQAEQAWNQGSKYDEGYKGNDLEKLWTAVSQFASGAANEVDLGTFTMGLTEGSALMTARRVGEKYNGLINSALKDMKMADGDMDMLMSHLYANGRKLEDLGAELDMANAELETMKTTAEDMVRRGDPKANEYAREYQKKVDAYNKRLNEEYKPLRDEYEKDLAAYQKVLEAVDSAVQNGLTDGERSVLDALEEFTNAKANRAGDVSTAAKAGAGAEQSAEFMLDFILTGGIGKAGTKAATKIATRRALKKMGAEALKGVAVKPGLGLRMATDAATAAVRTAVMVPRNLKAYGEQLAEYTGKDELGRINFDKSRLDAALNTAVTQYIEYWSEGFGEYFGEAEQALFRNITKAAPKTAIGQTLKGYRGSIGKYLDYGKFDGMFNEMLEEVVGSSLNALSGWLSNDRVGDKDALKEFFAGENLATLALSFLPMSAIGAAMNLSAYHKMKTRYDEGAKMLDGFVNSGLMSREEVESLTAGMTDMTPEQIKGNIVKLADKVRERNGGALPADFAKNLLGYVEGSFAQDLRHDEWEESQEKMAVVGAYTDAYARADVRSAWDADQAEAEAKGAALSAGFTEEELDADPFILGQDAAALRDTELERSQALTDYAVAKARNQGLRNGFMNMVDHDAEKYENNVRENLDRDGIVVMAYLEENGQRVPVFVMSKDAVIGPDGKVTVPTGDIGTVKIKRSEKDAQGVSVKANKLSDADVQLTDVFVTEETDAMKRRANEFYEAARKTVSPAGQARALYERVGHTVVVDDHQGVYEPFVVESITDDGTEVVISGDKKALQGVARRMGLEIPPSKNLKAPVRALYPLLAKEADGSLSTFEQAPAQGETAGEEGKTEPAERQEQAAKVNPDELADTDRTVMIDGRPTTVHVDSVGGDGVWYTYRDEQGVEREGDMSLDAFTAALVDEQAQAPAAENPAQAPAQTNAFPVDEKTGKRVFDHPSVTPERAYHELMDGVAPGSKNESNRRKFIESSAAKAAKDLADAQNKIAGLQARRDAVDEWEINDDEDIDAFEARQNEERGKIDDEIAQVEAQIPELQRKAAHWNAVRDMAKAVAYMRKDARLVARADSWTQRTGVKVKICRTPDEVDDGSAKRALAKGERVMGWYNEDTGEVGLYLPNIPNESEVDKTFIHEVVAHKGLKEVLGGKDNYDALCDKVWDQLMSEEDRKKFLAYNSHLKGDEQFLRRAAADEWIAHYSETLGLEQNRNLFDKFVEFVKEFLDRILGEDAKISKEDIETLLKSSLARYESERKADKKAELFREGIASETQAAQLDDNAIRFNIKTEESVEQKIRDFAKSKEGRKLGWTDAQIDSIISETADLMRAIHAAVSGDKYYDEWAQKDPTVKVDWRDGVEKPTVTWSRANIEYKYDMSADLLCINNEGLETVLASPTMVELMLKINETANDYKEGFTSDDYLRLYETLRDMGFVVPCKGCFDAAVRLKSLPTVSKKFVELVNKIIDERNADPVAFDRKVRAKAGDNATISGLPGSANNMEDAIRTGVVGDNLTEHISWAQLMSAEGQTKALSDWGGIFRAWERTGAGRPKDKLLPEPWSGDIVNTTTTIIGKFGEKTPSYRAISVNQGTGLRRNSHSEFRPLLAIDEIQFMREAFIRGLTVFKYMKELDDVRLFGKLGVKFNMSFFPAFVEGAPAAGLDANGNYIAAEESVGGREFEYVGEDGKTHYDGMKGWQEAMKYINKDVSLSSVIFSIPHLIKAFTDVPTKSDPRGIWGSLIPFHATGATFASLKRQGLGEARALGHSFEEALTDYGKGVTNFEAVQNDMFGEGWEVVEGKKAGTKVEPGHKLEFANGTHYYNAGLGLHLFKSTYIFDSEMDEHPGEFASVKAYAEKYGHPYSIDYNDKVRELGTGTAYQDASDYYIDMLRSLGLVPRFDFEVPEDVFLMMCDVVNVDPRHPKLGWKGEGHSWSPVDSEAYYSLWCDYGMIDPETGVLAPHNPVGIVDAEGNRVFQLPENTVDIIKDGVARYGERKDREAARELDAIEEFARRTVAEGKLKQEDADAIISQARAEQEAQDVSDDGSWTHFRKLEDPAKIEELENGEWEDEAYRAVQFVPDPNGEWEYDLGDGKGMQKGNVYPPMSAQTEKGEWRNPIQKGVIEESEEAPGKAFLKNGKWVFRLHKGNGKYVDAAYNPYIHSSDTMLNDQFSEAQSRGNLVVMRVSVPKSELDGDNPYQAEKAKDHVGRHDWKAGPIQGELTGTRTVYLSRYDKPMELMPIEKVGESVAKMLEGQVETMPTNVVWPQLRAELEKRGMEFVETDNKGKLVSGENAGKTWKQVYGKKKSNGGKAKKSAGSTRFRIANQTQNGFVSNAEASIDRIKMDKATPEQWVKMLEKEGGLKAGEDKWLGLSDWLKSQDKKSLTKQEIADYIAENRIWIEEQRYAENVDAAEIAKEEIRENVGQGKSLEELQAEVDELVDSDEYKEIGDAEEQDEWLRDKMIERYGEYFDSGYFIDSENKIDYAVMPWDIDETEIMRNYGGTRRINSTRLNYTTEGLDNKREIALTVPTIEPWNQGDNIHFGDAGEGRAVAWVRFGDTTTKPEGSGLYSRGIMDELERKYGNPRAYDKMTDEDVARAFLADYVYRGSDGDYRAYKDLFMPMDLDAERVERVYPIFEQMVKEAGNPGNRVLVIDEIQSKRHQEGREKGYDISDISEVENPENYEIREYSDYDGEKKYIVTDKTTGNSKKMGASANTPEKAIVAYVNSVNNAIPAAPFEKNWHELAMKRMLRLAAEEGYDYVAWTTGAQQADRYNMESAIGKLYASKDGEKYYVEVYDPNGNEITFNGLVGDSRSSGTYTPEELVKNFGKEAAKEIIASADALPSEEEAEKLHEKYNASGTKEDRDAWRKASFAEIDGSELFKGEGMKGFYDDILPRFMNKYGKKWGVKVSDITLPNVEEAGRVMHAVPVTQEMKESVMEGQTMFRITPEQDKEYMEAVNSGDMEKAGQMVRDAFKAAFPDTKVVDENGDPLVVYRVERWEGDTADYTVFDENKGGNWRGFYFTNRDAALKNYGDESTLRAFFLDSKNPFTENNFNILQGDKQELIDMGYDGMIFAPDGIDARNFEVKVFEPTQIKSADPVTYDDNGNVIPLSERFNPENNDIRFRVAPTEEQRKEERIAAAERIVTGKTLDSMPQAIGAGVMQVSRSRMPAGHKTDKGYYDPATNTVSVCMDNVRDERDAVATVLHETVGRKGLQGLFGERYRELMSGSYAALDAEGRARVNGYILRNGLALGDDAILRGMEEYMARLSEREESAVLDAVNDILSQAVDFTVGTEGFRFTNRELAYMLRASYEHMKNPNWLDTPAGKAKDTLWKRELGINETDPNRPTDPERPDGGTRFRIGATNATTNYEERMKEKSTIAKMEIQNADIPVKVGYEEILKEKYGDKWEEKMKGLRSDEDYLMRHNLSSSRADTENHNFKLFHFDPMIEKVREVQRKLAGDNASQQELMDAYERILDYLYAVSGLERNEWERNNGGEAKDWSGLTSLTGHPKEEWREAEDDARRMVDILRTELRDAFWTDGKRGSDAQAEADALLAELWDSIRSCTDFSLDHAYKYGLLTKAEYERLRGTDTTPRLWNYYLPLRGFTTRTAEEEYDYAGIMSSGARDTDVVKDAKGRWTEADNPLAYIANIAQKEIVQGNENWARQALLRFVRNVGENSLLSERKPWLVKVAGSKNKWVPAEPEEDESIEDFEARMQEAKKTGDARQGRKGLELGLVMANKGHRNQHLIHVKVGGEDRMIWVNGNPAIARAVSGAGKEPNYEMWRKASRVISNTFTTYSLDFTAKNLLRDSIYSRMAMLAKEDRHYRHQFEKNWWANGGFSAAPMIRLAAMWDSGELQRKDPATLTRRERMFIDFMHDGGQTGYTIVRNVEKMKKEIEKTLAPSTLSKVVDGAKVKVAGVDVPILGIYTWGVRTLNEAFELLTRFTAYETSRDMGRDGQRSAYDAKEISVNFNRRGAQSNKGFWGHVAAYFGGTHYFFNAGIQGFDNFLRLYKTNPKAMTAESVAVMALGFFTPMINALLAGGGDGDDDKKWYETDWYWNLPEWVRRNNIVLGWPEKDEVDENGDVKKKRGASYFAIPLPVEFRALYGLGDITNSVFLSHTYANPSPGPGDWGKFPAPGNVFLDILSTASGILPVNPIEGYNGKSVDLKDAVLRSIVPDLTIFGVDWLTNQDYTGRQLKKDNMFAPQVPDSQGAYASTPKALVEACQWMGEHFGVDFAPGVVRDALSNYGGGFYKFAEDLSKRMFTDDEHPKRWDDIPFLSGFTGHIDEDRTITYVNNVLNEYKDVSENIVKKMNLYNRSDNIKAEQAFVDTDQLPAKARVQALLSGKDYELARMYYLGMEDEHTGEYARVEHIYQSGKSKGKRYSRREEIKIPGVKKLKKTWKDAREYWASLPEKTEEEKAEKAQAYADMTNAWHEYYNAAADLAQKLMDYEYGKE